MRRRTTRSPGPSEQRSSRQTPLRYVLADSLRGQQVIHFADNVAANCGAIGGGSSSPSMGRIIHALHMRWAFERINPWIEFVKSEANLADDPSRGDMTWAEGLGAVPIEFVFPPCGGWDDSM